MNVYTSRTSFDELEPWLDQARREGAHLDRRLKSPWTLIKATSEAGAVFGWVGVLHRSKANVTIRGWYVRSEFRGMGIGRHLLLAAADFAVSDGAERIELRTNREWVRQWGFEDQNHTRVGGNQEHHYVLTTEADRQGTMNL